MATGRAPPKEPTGGRKDKCRGGRGGKDML